MARDAGLGTPGLVASGLLAFGAAAGTNEPQERLGDGELGAEAVIV